MMSISKPQKAEQAGSYYVEFEKEEYYQKNDEKGYFFGKGLEVLGVPPGTEINKETYTNMVNGYHPLTGEKLTKNAGGENRRAGFDVTFSAPKSVSLLLETAEINNNNLAQKIKQAQANANNIAMQVIQNNYTTTRVANQSGEMITVPTDGLCYASFQHTTSRAIDPQLHQHNFIFNVATYTDPNTGLTKTLSMTNEEIYRQKMFLGQTYRNELAKQLKELGLEIELTDAKHGFFEIKDFDKKAIEEFSQMSKILEQEYNLKLDDLKAQFPNLPEERLKEFLKLEKRARKVKVDKEETKIINKERLERFGFDSNYLEELKVNLEKNDKKITPDFNILLKNIEDSIQEITETQSVFSKENILKVALKYGIESGYTLKNYKEAFNHMVEKNNIVKLEKNTYSTIEMIKLERKIIDDIASTKDKFSDKKISKNEDMLNFLSKDFETMNDQQKKMFFEIIINKDQFMAVQGDAGTGKTFSMKALNQYLKETNNNSNIIGLSFTGKASEGLETDSGIKSTTIHKFLLNEKKDTTKNRTIIIDEAGMLGSRQTAEIMEIAKRKGDTVVFVGDTKQLAAVSAGNCFLEMQNRGIKTIYLDKTMRQKTEYTQKIVKSLKDKDFEKAFNILNNEKKIEEIPNTDDIIEKISNEYLNSKSKKETLIISSKNEERRKLNNSIRSKLDKKGVEIETQEALNFTQIQKSFTSDFKEGMIIQIQNAKGFRAGETVEVVNTKDDKLILKTKDDKMKYLNLNQEDLQLGVYQKVAKNFDTGEKIVFTKNIDDRKNKFRVKNGQQDIIKSISPDGDIETEKGLKFNVKQNPFFDYGYAITDYKAQGVTSSNVIVMTNNNMSNTNSFYTQVTRVKNDLKIYTTNIDELKSKVGVNQVNQSTLDYELDEKIEKLLEKTEKNMNEEIEKLMKKAVEKTEKKSTTQQLR